MPPLSERRLGPAHCTCSSRAQKLPQRPRHLLERLVELARLLAAGLGEVGLAAAFAADDGGELTQHRRRRQLVDEVLRDRREQRHFAVADRSEEHTSELQSPYVISYAVFC